MRKAVVPSLMAVDGAVESVDHRGLDGPDDDVGGSSLAAIRGSGSPVETGTALEQQQRNGR
jgi:hypothetical protein